ncbi:helix-turn-helix domain-containing protein [Nonomuraea mangrovi]|uniref:Helix-turn-helix domain-containing protein n=1 Tax=Nonomuraea mangrovi TaxID=2316207 RepID=A0ABW4SZ11_9ACTN
MATEHLTKGQRIARARHRKGWDQAALAEKIGRSVSWLSKVENERMPLDRMSVVGQLAEVLGVEVSELTGQPYRHESADLDSGHAAIPGLRLALQQATMPGGAALLAGRQPRSLDELEAHVRLAEQLRKLPHARLHDLRHIHATTLLLAGVPVHVVAARLGHADPSITLRVYAHVVRAAEASAADVFAQAIGE